MTDVSMAEEVLNSTAFVEERRLGKDVDDSGGYDAGKESDAEVWRWSRCWDQRHA